MGGWLKCGSEPAMPAFPELYILVLWFLAMKLVVYWCTWEGVPHVVGCQMWQKVSEELLCGNYPTYVASQQFVPYCPNYLLPFNVDICGRPTICSSAMFFDATPFL